MNSRFLALAVFCVSSALAQVPQGNSFKGSYVGTFSNGDQFALVVSKKTDASIFIVGTASRSVGSFLNFALGDEGSFAISRDGTTISGRISQGSVTGTVPQRGMTFSGTTLPSTGTTIDYAGYYFGTAYDHLGNEAFCVFVISANNRALYYVESPTFVNGAVGTIDARGQMTLTSATGATGTAAFMTRYEGGAYSGSVTLLPVGRLSFFVLRKQTPYKLANVATRGLVGTEGNILIAGFVVSAGAKSFLIRAAGPTLGALGVGGVLTDPVLSVFDAAGRLVSTNDNWNSLSTLIAPADVVAATRAAGAFSFPLGSRDAAILISLEPGNYTAQVSGVGNTTGVALVEVYDVD